MKLGQLGFTGSTIRERTNNLGIYRPESNIKIKYYNTGQIKNFVLTSEYLILAIGSTPMTAINDMFFSPDGTKLYLLFNGISTDSLGFPSGQKSIYQLNLSTAWEISSWSSSSSLVLSTSDLSTNLSGTYTNPQVESFHFSTDGKKLFILTSYLYHSSTVYSTNAVCLYSSSAAWDITYFIRSTASSGTLQLPSSTNPTQYTYPYYNSGSYNRSSERDIWVDPGGGYVRILCDEGDLQNGSSFTANRDNIKEYYLSTEYDLSTADLNQDIVSGGLLTYDAAMASIEYQTAYYSGNSNDGPHSYNTRGYLVVGGEFDKGAAGIGANGTTTVGAMTYSTDSASYPNTGGFQFRPDNYTVFWGAVDLGSYFTKINGIELDITGSNMQVCGNGSNVYTYFLESNWQADTVITNISKMPNTGSTTTLGRIPRCFAFNSTGTKLVVYSTTYNDEATPAFIFVYDLSSAFDITTNSCLISSGQVKTISSSTTYDRHPVSISVNDSGTILYLIYAHGDPDPPYCEYRYPDATTVSFHSGKFKYIQEMHMSTAWRADTLHDPTPTPSEGFDVDRVNSSYFQRDAKDIFVTDDYVFILKEASSSNTTYASHLYRFSGVSNWNVDSAYNQRDQRVSLVNSGVTNVNLANAFWFADNGTKLYTLEWKTVSVSQWSLSTGYDLSTLSFVRKEKWFRQYAVGTTIETVGHKAARQVTRGDFEPTSICFDPSGDHMFIQISVVLGTISIANESSVRTTTGFIFQYDLKDPNYRWDIRYYGNSNTNPNASAWYDDSLFFDNTVKAHHGMGAIRWNANGDSLYSLLEQGEIRRRERTSGITSTFYMKDLNRVDFDNYYGNASRCKSGAFFTETYGPLEVDTTFDQHNYVSSFCFGDSGNKLYVLSHDDAKILTLDLSTAYDISSASARTYRLALNVDSILDFTWANKRYVVNSPYSGHFDFSNGYIFIGEDLADRINRYKRLVGSASTHIENFYWDQSVTQLSGSGAASARPSGIYLNSAGTQLSILDNFNNDITQYSLSTAFDLTSTLTNTGTISLSVVGKDYHDLWFEPNGGSFYFGSGDVNHPRLYRYKINSSASNFNPNMTIQWNLNDALSGTTWSGNETYTEILDVQWERYGHAFYVLTYNRLFRFERKYGFGDYEDHFDSDGTGLYDLVYDSCIGYTTGVENVNFGTIGGLPGLNSNDYFRCFYQPRNGHAGQDRQTFFIVTQTGKVVRYKLDYSTSSSYYNGFDTPTIDNTKIFDLKHIDYNVRGDINWFIFDLYFNNANVGISNGSWIRYDQDFGLNNGTFPNNRENSGLTFIIPEVKFNFSNSQEEISGSIQKFDFKSDDPFIGGDSGEKIIFDTSSDQLVIRELDGTFPTTSGVSTDLVQKLKFASPATTEGIPKHNLDQVFSYYGNFSINGKNINSSATGITRMSSFWWHASRHAASGMNYDLTDNQHDKLFIYDSDQGHLYQLEHIKS